MSRTTSRTVTRQTEEVPEIPAETEAEQVDSEIEGFKAQLPEGAMMSLYRMVEGGEKEWVTEMAVVDFSVAQVQSQFGGGRFLAYLRKPDPNAAGKWIRQGSRKIRIASTTAPSAAAVAAGGPAAAVDATKLLANYGELVQTQITNSLNGQQMLQQMQLAVLKSLTERPPDPTAKLLEIVLPLLLRERSGGGTDLAGLVALADKLASKTSPMASFKEALGVLKDARELTGPVDDETPAWMKVASRGLDVLAKVAERSQLALPPGEPAAPPAGDPPAAAPAAAAPPLEDFMLPPTAHPVFRFLAPQMPMLLAHAEKDHDPATYAGLLADSIPEEHADAVLTVIEAPGFLQELAGYFPAIAPQLEWFNELRALLAGILHPEPEPPAAEAPSA